ncbi:MAG: ATP-binding cassette domain-containing protein [Xanthomonadales bacterium]|nr:ATP-binding cassette domain-containing protein [Xanthomonadales bacterium]
MPTPPPRLALLVLRNLWPFLRRQGWLLALWLATLAASGAATLILPHAFGRMLDAGFQRGDVADRAFGLMFCAAIAYAVSSAAQFWSMTYLGERVVADLRTRLYAHLIGLDAGFHDGVRSGELLSRLGSDAELLRQLVGSALPVALGSAIAVVGGLSMLIVTSPELAAWSLLVLPLSAIPVMINGKRLARIARDAQDRVAEANARAAETLAAADTVRAHAREAHERGRYADALRRAVRAADRRIVVQALITFAATALVFGVLLTVLWRGVRGVVDHDLTVGGLGQFVGYAMLCGLSFGQLIEIWNDVQRAAGGMGRIRELLERTPAILPPARPEPLPRPLRGALRFESVGFRYPSRPGHAALDGFDLQIAPGERVALVGPSGAGKSTVLSLLLRFHDPAAGRVLADGVDLRRFDPAAWRGAVALVPQAPTLFAATVAENLRYARLDADDDALRDALRTANALDFVEVLPQGLDTPLGERGVLLSGGQRQRIAIARAVLADAPVLLLDEATSALDAQSERAIQEALDTLMRGRTTVVVAHRLATVKKADRIVVMDRGGIVAEGTHATLLAQGGLYAELANLQFLS